MAAVPVEAAPVVAEPKVVAVAHPGGQQAAPAAPTVVVKAVNRAPAAAAQSAAAPVRTMEDTVAELLRPMLREWLNNNMPRIVEKALRVEMANIAKAGDGKTPKA